MVVSCSVKSLNVLEGIRNARRGSTNPAVWTTAVIKSLAEAFSFFLPSIGRGKQNAGELMVGEDIKTLATCVNGCL